MRAPAISRLAALAAALLLAAPLHAQPGGGAENVVLAVPNVALTFAPGYLADLAAFDRDLYTIPPDGLLKAEVIATMVGGIWRHKQI